MLVLIDFSGAVSGVLILVFSSMVQISIASRLIQLKIYLEKPRLWVSIIIRYL